MAGVRPAPPASRKERSKGVPHYRGALGRVAPAALVDRTTWPNSHSVRWFRALDHRVERHPHLGVQHHRGEPPDGGLVTRHGEPSCVTP